MTTVAPRTRADIASGVSGCGMPNRGIHHGTMGSIDDGAGHGIRSATRPRLNAMLIRSAIVASLGGLLFGFDTAVISGTTDWLKNVFTLSDFALALP